MGYNPTYILNQRLNEEAGRGASESEFNEEKNGAQPKFTILSIHFFVCIHLFD